MDTWTDGRVVTGGLANAVSHSAVWGPQKVASWGATQFGECAICLRAPSSGAAPVILWSWPFLLFFPFSFSTSIALLMITEVPCLLHTTPNFQPQTTTTLSLYSRRDEFG